ncbi:hypothetical protein PT974_00137 [Cladobotryum mycophilum]|uniref:2EXR domain-containing protein n=1 Tax=Cladobotryum mycophilum TaxID=491253 RepID=A0ABR0T098_9HYPO
MASLPIKFHIPDECRTFTPFPRLPPELRDQIWRTTLSAPGMHFVKLESRGRSWRWVSMSRSLSQSTTQHNSGNAEENDEIAMEVRHEVAPKQMWDTQLVPIAPTKESDLSCYHNVHQQLTTLALTCKESLATTQSLTSRPGILRLGNGSILSLANSSDVIFLEYFPPELYETGCSFGIDPNCPDLDLIKRVAVRFCHQWQEKSSPSVCTLCGQVHDSNNRVVYPMHLYQFLARHLPNLEEFFFVDYFLLRKNKDESRDQNCCPSSKRVCHEKSPSLTIKCGNRTFYEANESEWNIKPQVSRLKDWVQDRFVRYAKMSRLSRHSNPEKVRFGLLACEWSITPPASQRRCLPAPTPSTQPRVIFRAEGVVPCRIDANVPFIFGNGAQNVFEFTFSVPSR